MIVSGKRNYYGLISELLLLPSFFFLELKRNASFLVCSVSAPEKKLRTNRYLTCG